MQIRFKINLTLDAIGVRQLFDAVILSYEVAEVKPHGGLPTIRVLRSEFPSLPIIAMSGNPKHLEVAGAIGANRILPKPFSVEQLATAVSEAIAASV